MVARIFRSLKSASQSGVANTKKWILEYVPENCAREIEPVMGWTSSSDMKQELTMRFSSLPDAESFAKKHNIEYEVIEDREAKLHIRSYSDNFK